MLNIKCEKYGKRLQAADTKRKEAISEAKAIVSLAEDQNRDLSIRDAKEIDKLIEDSESAKAEIERLEKLQAFDNDVDHSNDGYIPQLWDGTPESMDVNHSPLPSVTSHKPAIIKDQDGQEIKVYSKGQSLSIANRDKPLSNDCFGRYVIALATGNRKICPEYAEAVTTDNAGGGYLVPNPLERQIIDKVRNQSVLARAGAVFADLDHGSTTIATVESGASFSSVGEGETIPTGQITFGSKLLNLRKRAVLIPMSEELLSDSYNAGQVIQDAVVKDAAEDLDNFIISGTNYGLVESNLITDTDASVGAIAWEDFHNMAVDLRAANEEPNAYVLHPTIAGDTDVLTTGDGSTSAKSWLGAPPSLEGITRLQTGNITTAYSIMGDFTQLLIGVKQGTFRVEISRDAGEYFAKDQIVLKVVYRVDYAITRSTAFRRLAGITT